MARGGWQRALYRAGWTLLGPLIAPVLAFHPRLRSPLGERLGRFPGVPRGAVWLHGASAGDVRALGPLAAALEAAGTPVLLTAFTSAGRALASRDGRAGVRALPMDHPRCVRRALDSVAPRALVLEARELWPELVLLSAERGIPCIVVDARVSERSARAYRRWRGLCGPLLGAPVRWCAVDGSAAAAIEALGVDAARIRVTGDMKIEATIGLVAGDGAGARAGVGSAAGETAGAGGTEAGDGRAAWAGAARPAGDAASAAGTAPGDGRAAGPGAVGRADRSGTAEGASAESGPRVVLGSVHFSECAALLGSLAPLAARQPEARFELVARRPSEEAAIRRAVERAGLGVRVDVRAELGILRAAYGGARAAFVGGSLSDRGGHNVLEPAVAGVPFVVGPFRRNAAPSLAVLRGPGAVEAASAEEVAAALGRWLADPAAARAEGAAVRARALAARGALERTLAVLHEAMAAGASA